MSTMLFIIMGAICLASICLVIYTDFLDDISSREKITIKITATRVKSTWINNRKVYLAQFKHRFLWISCKKKITAPKDETDHHYPLYFSSPETAQKHLRSFTQQ